MPFEKHNLVMEFPNLKEKIHELKQSDGHFSHLFEKYHDIDREIYRIESGIETPEDSYVEGRKKERLLLKDELLQILNAHAS